MKKRKLCFRTQKSEQGADGFVDADVGRGIAADEIEAAVVHGEVDEAADVVVLIERGEDLDGFFGIEAECVESDGIAPLFRE